MLVGAVGACSSSGSSTSATATATPKSGTEMITATLTGGAAANYLNSNGSTQPSSPSLVFTGPVSTTAKGPVTLGGTTAKTASKTFVTPAGNLVVQRTVKTSDSQLVPAGKRPDVLLRGTEHRRLYGGQVAEHRDVRGRGRPAPISPRSPLGRT